MKHASEHDCWGFGSLTLGYGHTPLSGNLGFLIYNEMTHFCACMECILVLSGMH